MAKESKKTYSKRMVKSIMTVALIDLQLTYVLAFLGKEQIAETLSSDICHTIIGIGLGYFMKSYFETKKEEEMKLLRGEDDYDTVP
jgi:hypothetical protein